jgi:predicted Zn finger-like uncharacterized protein
MILICPNCSARFMIDASALGDTGRTVRCGACGHSWLQLPEPAPPAAEEAPPPEAAAPAAELPPPPQEMAKAGAAAASAAADAAAAEVEKDSAKRRRRRRFAEAPSAETAAAPARGRGYARVLVWFLFVFVVTAIVLGGIQYRQQIVRIWPAATMLYEMVGLDIDPVSGYGLYVANDSIRFRRESEGGTPILVLSGDIENKSKKAQRVTPMRIVMLDTNNRVLRTERVRIEDRVIDPGKKLPFQVSIPNYPPEIKAVRITFDLTG